MKKVLSVIACSVLAACSCSDNQWEDVDVTTYEEPVYEEETIVEPAPAPEPVYTPAPQPACPCAVQPVCYQPVCYQPCPCMVQPQPVVMPAPQPKITTTKKIITTTTTMEEHCGKPVGEPVVTTHEEVLPTEVNYINTPVDYSGYGQPVAPVAPMQSNYMEVTVNKDPYRPEVVDMRSVAPKVDAAIAAKYSPEAYNVVATRATNRMLQDMAAYTNGGAKTAYLNDTKVLSSDLPYGSHRLKSATKDIIDGSRVLDLVNSPNSADYIIDSATDWYVANNSAPALQYRLSLLDRSGRKVNEWVEVIRQVQD